MSEHRPVECLDGNCKMYKSAVVQNLDKVKADTEGRNRLINVW